MYIIVPPKIRTAYMTTVSIKTKDALGTIIINSAICVLCREDVVLLEVQNVLELISRTCNTSSRTLNMAPEKATEKKKKNTVHYTSTA